jgi:hypothetical protein
VRYFGELFRWEEQFGYSLDSGVVNLDALRDGFDFEVPEQGGVVLELAQPDVMWREDPKWLLGLLSIIQEHSRFHLAFGCRFFALLYLKNHLYWVKWLVKLQSHHSSAYRTKNN